VCVCILALIVLAHTHRDASLTPNGIVRQAKLQMLFWQCVKTRGRRRRSHETTHAGTVGGLLLRRDMRMTAVYLAMETDVWEAVRELDEEREEQTAEALEAK
jgi:hypothetical protein